MFILQKAEERHTDPDSFQRGQKTTYKVVTIGSWLCVVICSYVFNSSDEPVVIPFKKLKPFTGKEIGRGSYGRVFEVEYRKTLCAAKELHELLLQQEDAFSNVKRNFLRECHIWGLLQHPCVVQFIG